MNLINIHEVLQRTGLSKSTIYTMMERCAFPARIKIGERASRWPDEDVESFVRLRRRGHPWQPVPVNLVEVAAQWSYDTGSEGTLADLVLEAEAYIKREGAQCVIEHLRQKGYGERFVWPNGTTGDYPTVKRSPKRRS